MYAVTLDQGDITWLAFAAGIAAGSGNAAAHASLAGILGRIQEVADYDPLASGDHYEAAQAADEDFGGTIDPQFMPAVAIGEPPSRPQSEFGPGPVRADLG